MRPEGDSAFPPIDPRVWQEMSRREQAAGPNDEASFTLLVYRRRLV
jgi:dihydrofolate reductase